MECIVGLLQAALGGLCNEQAGCEEARLAGRGLGAGGGYPGRAAQLVHREPLARVNGEEAFGEISSSRGDVAPGVPL